MRFFSLLPFLLILKCGPGPSSDAAADLNVSVADQEEAVAAEPTASEPEAPVASVITEIEVTEEEEEILRIWDRAWPETLDRKNVTVPEMTDGGIALSRTFVTDTVNLTPETEDYDGVDAIFVSLIDFAAGKNANVNEAINNQLMSSILERPKRTGTPKTRLREASRRLTRNFQQEGLKNTEEAGEMYAYHHAVTTTVRQNDDAFLVMMLESYVYRGGANGGFFREDLSFSTKTGKLIKLKDIILWEEQAAFLKTLHAVALAEGHDGTPEAADFPLPDNFLFTAAGLSFHYPEYSEALSNRWMANLVIPFSQLNTILTKTGKEMMKTQQLNGDENVRGRSLEQQ